MSFNVGDNLFWFLSVVAVLIFLYVGGCRDIQYSDERCVEYWQEQVNDK